MNSLLIYIDGMARFAPASLAKQNTHFLVQSKSDAVASRQQETLLRDMQQKVLHFDCRSKIRGSIPPYLLSLCQRSKCQPYIFVWFFFYFFLILISSMVEQDTSNIQIQVRVLDKNIYSYCYIKKRLQICLHQ